MDSYFPWIMVGVSGLGLYTEHLLRELHARWQEAVQNGHPRAQNYPSELLEAFCERMASKKMHLWVFVIVGTCWGLIDLL